MKRFIILLFCLVVFISFLGCKTTGVSLVNDLQERVDSLTRRVTQLENTLHGTRAEQFLGGDRVIQLESRLSTLEKMVSGGSGSIFP